MSPTRAPMLIVVAVISTVLGLTVADVVEALVGRPIPVPLSSAVTIAALAVVLAVWAEVFRRRLGRPERVDPFVAVRSAALAMAASRAGAIILGCFAGVGIWFALDLSSQAARERALICALGAVSGLALTVVGLWLERVCRLPGGDEDDSHDGGPEDPGAHWISHRFESDRLGV